MISIIEWVSVTFDFDCQLYMICRNKEIEVYFRRIVEILLATGSDAKSLNFDNFSSIRQRTLTLYWLIAY